MHWTKYPHVVFAGKALEFHRIRSAGLDVDVLAGPELWNALIQEGHIPRPAKRGGEVIVIEYIEFFTEVGIPMTFEEIRRDAVQFGDVTVMSLHHLLEWKKSMAREKDLADVKLILAAMDRE